MLIPQPKGLAGRDLREGTNLRSRLSVGMFVCGGCGRASGPERPAEKAGLPPVRPTGSGASAVKGSGAESSKQARRVPPAARAAALG